MYRKCIVIDKFMIIIAINNTTVTKGCENKRKRINFKWKITNHAIIK